jgi:hypothetical protein
LESQNTPENPPKERVDGESLLAYIYTYIYIYLSLSLSRRHPSIDVGSSSPPIPGGRFSGEQGRGTTTISRARTGFLADAARGFVLSGKREEGREGKENRGSWVILVARRLSGRKRHRGVESLWRNWLAIGRNRFPIRIPRRGLAAGASRKLGRKSPESVVMASGDPLVYESGKAFLSSCFRGPVWVVVMEL